MLAGCSSSSFFSSADSPYIGPNTEGIKLINPPGYESHFCTVGTKRDLGGMAAMHNETQYAMGDCRRDLLSKENMMILYFGEETEMDDYADAELDVYLRPGDYMGAKEEAEERCGPGTECMAHKDFISRGALVYFDVDSESPLSVAELQRVAQVVRNRNTNIAVIGHADNTYTEAHNMPLSVRRAKKVREILISFGVPENRIVIAGRSSNEPADTNDTVQGRAKNRRAEIKGGSANEH